MALSYLTWLTDCLSQFTCNDAEFGGCFQYPTDSTRAAWHLTRHLRRDETWLTGTLTSTSYPTNSVYVKAVLVAHEASDEAVLALATQTSSTNRISPATSTVTVYPTSGSERLPDGAVAGIAVGTFIAGAILAAISTVVLLRFCLGYGKRRDQAAPVKSETGHSVMNGQHQHEANTTSELPSVGQSMTGRHELTG